VQRHDAPLAAAVIAAELDDVLVAVEVLDDLARLRLRRPSCMGLNRSSTLARA